MTIKKLLPILMAFCSIIALPPDDLASATGMIGTVAYSGFLKTNKVGRQLHYVYIQGSMDQHQDAPLTIWFNGGPGCSSLIGLLQQIGPYTVGNTYKLGDMLTPNQYSWNKISNLLFIESPAIVGYSTDTDYSYPYTDKQTAEDAFAAIKDFIFNKASQFSNNSLFLSGESYAGKYVPDITDLIINHNRQVDEEDDFDEEYINLNAILVGNGVMSFEDNSLDKSEIQYMISHSFMSSKLERVYETSCQIDYHSPRCKFFRFENEILEAYLNPYNVYEVCQDRAGETKRMLQVVRKMSLLNRTLNSQERFTFESEKLLKSIPDCPSDDGIISYWNLNKHAYNVDHINKTWDVCSNINYAISIQGSIEQYSNIFMNKGIKVWLFVGDWDDVVPYNDVEKNIKNKLIMAKTGPWSPWNIGDHHSGFYQTYNDGFTVITVKGAGHMVPQTQPKSAYQLFSNFINGKPVNNQIF